MQITVHKNPKSCQMNNVSRRFKCKSALFLESSIIIIKHNFRRLNNFTVCLIPYHHGSLFTLYYVNNKHLNLTFASIQRLNNFLLRRSKMNSFNMFCCAVANVPTVPCLHCQHQYRTTTKARKSASIYLQFTLNKLKYSSYKI